LEFLDYFNKFSFGSPAFHTLQGVEVDAAEFFAAAGPDVDVPGLVVAFPAEDNVTTPRTLPMGAVCFEE